MPNDELVTIIKQGLQRWNSWREKHPNEKLDFSSADLAFLFVSDMLAGAKLDGANLSGAILECAYLEVAELLSVNLADADLTGAFLAYADIWHSNLAGANLTGADLEGATLDRSTLDGANFTEVTLLNSKFLNVDLSSVIGLDTVIHKGPSTIGLDTIYLSKGRIPDVFLRGAGVPEHFIAYLPSLIEQPIQFYSCFISYSTKDDDFAHRLHKDLQEKGVRCWFAPENLKIGDRFTERIEETILDYNKVLLVLSEHSVASPWVEREVNAALEREYRRGETILFPIRLDNAIRDSPKSWAASVRRERHIGDFRNWKNPYAYKKAITKLLRDLNSTT